MRTPDSEWEDISSGLHPDRFTSEVVASKWNESTVYVTQNGRRSDDFAAYVWRSTDYGRRWESLAASVPFGPVNILREDPKNPNLLYLGTDVGVYVSLDRGATWNALPGGMPSTFVDDLIVHPRDDMMIAATHGQGMFAFDVRQLQQLTPEVVAQGVHLFHAEEGLLPPAGRPAFGQRPMSAWVHYWLGAPATSVEIEIRDAEGDAIATLQGDASRGLHQVEWTLERSGATPSGAFFTRAAWVAPGTYTVVLRIDGSERTTTVTVGRRSAP